LGPSPLPQSFQDHSTCCHAPRNLGSSAQTACSLSLHLHLLLPASFVEGHLHLEARLVASEQPPEVAAVAAVASQPPVAAHCLAPYLLMPPTLLMPPFHDQVLCPSLPHDAHPLTWHYLEGLSGLSHDHPLLGGVAC